MNPTRRALLHEVDGCMLLFDRPGHALSPEWTNRSMIKNFERVLWRGVARDITRRKETFPKQAIQT
jgi:ABC-type arginine transport system ATPase subunit